ncbi:MAG: peptidylprolyl isomerase [Planctomycetes bacterium]|nr:peptidylprolyl isomerase [Planctomycetota bacterium]
MLPLTLWISSAAMALCAGLGGSAGEGPTPALQAEPAPAVDPSFADTAVVASAFDTTVTWKELEPVFVLRRVLAKDGRDALEHLAKSRLLEAIAAEQGLVVPDKEIDARIAEIEQQLRASGDPDGLAGQMKKAHMTPAEFRRYLRLATVHEVLTRRALGKKDGEPVTTEQQELYLEHVLEERSFAMFSPPWADGVAAKAGAVVITAREYLVHLRRSLRPETLHEDAYQVLLLKRIRQRMPDLAPDKHAKAVEDELARRRDAIAADPRYKGIPYEKLLAAQGVLADRLREDPDVQCQALARLWVERNYDDATLKRVYADEREHLDALYGPAIETRMVFLRAADFSREADLRTFKDAEKRLVELQPRVKSLEDFIRLAKEASEDAATREKGGDLGWVTVGNPRAPEAVRQAVEKELKRSPTLVASSAGSMTGPVRLPNGAALLWLGARRGVPSWEQMAFFVQRELRQRFLDEALPRTKMVEVFQ